MRARRRAAVKRDGIWHSVSDLERRLAALQREIESGEVPRTPAIEQVSADLSVSLEELNVALEELESTNEELAASKLAAEREGLRYAELFQLAPAACFVTDLAGVIEEANFAAKQLLDRSARQLLGKPLSTFVSANDQPRFFRLLDRIAQSPAGTQLGEETFGLRDVAGRSFEAGITVLPSSDLDGTHRAARWLVRDLSDQLRAERMRRQAGERAAYRHVAGGVIHHLNNLLGSIRGYSDMLSRERSITSRGLRAASQIHAATLRGERLTNQLLAFARVSRRKPERLVLDSIAHEACLGAREFLTESSAIEERLAAGRDARICVDGEDLYQAILGLIFNAQEARRDGGEIIVETALHDIDEDRARELAVSPGRFACVVVRDSGVGMEQETRERALEPFFSTKPISTGFGLGLSTVEAILLEASGAIAIESELGMGSAVTLYLPLA